MKFRVSGIVNLSVLASLRETSDETFGLRLQVAGCQILTAAQR